MMIWQTVAGPPLNDVSGLLAPATVGSIEKSGAGSAPC